MKTPWHLWVVGGVTLLFNSGGAYDYVMTETRNAAYMSNFTPEQLEFFYGFPSWAVGLWAIAVWGAVLGSVFLLLRSNRAVLFFTVSCGAMVGTFFHNYVLSEVKMQDVVGPETAWFTGLIILVAFATLIYAIVMARRGVLKSGTKKIMGGF